jgi:hypothetical protein
MKFSYSATWDDAVGLLRAHAPLIAALAGVFIFLPALLVGYFLPQPQPAAGAEPGELFRLLGEYFSQNWHWLLIQSLVNSAGTLAILILVFARQGTSVGGAIAAAVLLLPFYFIASLLSAIMLGIGFVLFIVPCLYLFGRLATLAPVVVAENRRNPIEAIARSFAVTRGKGWAVLGLVLLVGIPGAIAMMVANMIFGFIFLAAGRQLGALLSLIVNSATATALSVVLILLYAAIYRALASSSEAAAAPAAD